MKTYLPSEVQHGSDAEHDEKCFNDTRVRDEHVNIGDEEVEKAQTAEEDK